MEVWTRGCLPLHSEILTSWYKPGPTALPTNYYPLLLMESPGKKWRREKGSSSLCRGRWATPVTSYCPPKLWHWPGDPGSQTHSSGGLRWGHSPPEKIGEHQGEIHPISASEEPLSLLWDGPRASSYDHMPPDFTGSPGSVPRREMVCRHSRVLKAESQLVFSAFLLLFPVVSSLAHCEAQPLPPCARSPVGRGGRSCRKSRVFWCSRDTGWAHATVHGPLGMISSTFTWLVPYLEAGMPPMLREVSSHKDLDWCFNIPPCF